MSAYLAIKHFCYFVEGRTFHVLTDHKPLTHALSSRQIRQLDFVSQFTSDIRHIKGEHNITAYALSRIAIIQENVSPTIDFHAIAAAQTEEHKLSLFMSGQSKCNLTLKHVPLLLPTPLSSVMCLLENLVQFCRLVFDK